MCKVNKSVKQNIFSFILGASIFCGIGVLAATILSSSSVSYSNTVSGLTSTNVQGAIDELYSKANNPVLIPNTETYTYPENSTGETIDLGVNNRYRYIDAGNIYITGYNDGLVTASATSSENMAVTISVSGKYGGSNPTSRDGMNANGSTSSTIDVTNFNRMQIISVSGMSYTKGTSLGSNIFDISELTSISLSGSGSGTMGGYGSVGSSWSIKIKLYNE